ncbi:MAG TPA: BTAD domain-containing putative transcriptional regulator [Burkholderiales bacterium]|nr:BTAD domain-containing putative transcriptional regulator [Burkholderiales bacterium]
MTAKKARALLAYLALAGGRPQSRDKLAAVLWTDSASEQARTSLRQSLTVIRKVLGDAGERMLRTDTGAVALTGIGVDVAAFENFAREATPESLAQAEKLYRGDLLDGFHAGEPTFDDWMSAERERLRGLVLSILTKLLAHHEQSGATERAIEYATRLIALDPLQEAVHRALMRLYDRQGRQAAAIKQYRLCRAVLQRELGVSPEPQTDALHQAILRDRRAASISTQEETPGAAEPEEPAKKSLTGPELRQATVLLADLIGHESFMSDDPEAAHVLLSDYREATRKLVRMHGGNMISAIGARVLLVFGVPIAYGNDSERAVRAALAIADSVANLKKGLTARIGIASGQVLSTEDADGVTLTGEPVGVATRIMEIAEAGAVLISNRVFQALTDKLNAACLEGAMARAIGKPGHLWRVHSFLDHVESQSARPFVGRQSELRQLVGVAETCFASGTGMAILIRGEAGIGKSRLVEAFAGAANEQGFVCHKVLVLDFGSGTSSDPIRVLARRLIGIGQGDTIEQRRIMIDRAVDNGLIERDQLVFVNDLLETSQPDALRMAFDAMDNTARTRGVRELLSRLIQSGAARRPLLIVVEDIHWADSLTLNYLAGVAAALKSFPVLLAMTTRIENDPINAAWRAVAHGCPLTTIDLGPLPEAEAKALATHYSHGNDEFARSCVNRAEGNPLFLDQLLRAGEAKGGLPDSLQSIVLARLDRLDRADRRAVQAASVLGQRFALDVLRHLIDDLAYECVALVEEVIVRPEGEDYLFVHALIHEAVHASMLKSHRQDLHRRAASWYAEKDDELAAEHLEAAGDPGAAGAYLRAAERQSHLYRHERALRLAERGLRLATDDVARHDFTYLMARMLRELGRTAEAVAAFRKALALGGDTQRKCRALLGLASALRIQDCYDDALSALAEAEAAASELDNAEALAEIHHMRGNVHFPMGNIAACLAAHETALRYARVTGAPAAEARALSGLGDAYYQRGRMLTAYDYFNGSVALAREHGLTRIEISNLPMLCVIDIYRLDFEAAFRHGQATLDLAARIGDYRTEIITRVARSALYLVQADWELAKRDASQAVALSRQVGARRFEAEAAANLAAAIGGMGQRAEAERLLDETWALSLASGVNYSGPTVLGFLAGWTTDANKRRWALTEGEALLDRGCVGHAYLDFYKGAITASLIARDWDGAERYAEALANYTRHEPFPWADFLIRFGRAMARVGRGDRSDDLRALLISLRAQAKLMTAALRDIDAAIGEFA